MGWSPSPGTKVSYWSPSSAITGQAVWAFSSSKTFWMLSKFFKSSKVQSFLGDFLFLNIFSEVKN
jgi:hypothetical protein